MAAPDKPRIQVILGSTREGRAGEPFAQWVFDQLSQRDDLTAELLDLRDFGLPFYNVPQHPKAGDYTHPEVRRWADTIRKADGYIFVTPEYNHGMPGVLKNALDWIYAEWNEKAVGFVSYGGAVGGARAVEQLRQVVIELRMAPIREAIHFIGASRVSDEGRVSKNDALGVLVDQLLWWTNALRVARNASAT